jgi:hypothetical protein
MPTASRTFILAGTVMLHLHLVSDLAQICTGPSVILVSRRVLDGASGVSDR